MKTQAPSSGAGTSSNHYTRGRDSSLRTVSVIQRRNIAEKFREIIRTVFPQSPKIAFFGLYTIFDEKNEALTHLEYFNRLAVCGATSAIYRRNVPKNWGNPQKRFCAKSENFYFSHFYPIFCEKIKVSINIVYSNDAAICSVISEIHRRNVAENFREIRSTVFAKVRKLHFLANFR